MIDTDFEDQPSKPRRPYCHTWVNPNAPQELKAAHKKPKRRYPDHLDQVLRSNLWYQYRHLGDKAGRPTEEQMQEFAEQHREAFAQVVDRFVNDRITTKFWFTAS